MELLRRTTIHFVHCLLPQHNAGLCDLKVSLADGKTSSRDDVMLNVPLVRAQIRGAELVYAVRLHRQGTHGFYRAMHVVLARYCYRKSSVRPSVCNVAVC